jgi:small subunit ribosomal protein S1
MSHETPPSDPTTPEAELEAERPSEEFAQALAAYEEAAPAPGIAEAVVGSKVSARVVSIGDENVLVDFGGRSEGAVETRHFRNEDGTLRVNAGDTLELYVIEAGDQIVLAPSIKTEAKAALGQLREAHGSGAPVSGKVIAVNAGGLAVDLSGVRGFCPMSQIESGFCADPSVYVGRTLEFVVTSVEEGRGSVVLSRRQILRRAEAEEGKAMLATLKVGDEREGKIRKLEAFGAFVDLGGVDGLVHISEISHSHVGHPKQVVKEGETVKVRILKIGTGKDGRPKLALSIKAASADPWQGIETRYAVGAHVTGTVARMTEFGAFVSLESGIDGLVHVSQAALHRVTHVKEVFKTGQSVEAVVLAVEPDKKRIALSVREALAASLPPARTPEVGEVVEGRVGSIKPFGVFVDLPEFGPRASGLMPREESGFPRGTDLAAHFTVGQVVRVELLESKEGKLRLRLEGATPVVEERAARPERPAGSGAPRSGGDRGPRPGGDRAGRGGPGGDRGGRGGPGGDRGGRGGPGGGRGREERGPQSWSTPVSPNEPTMMALALRKAMEEAKRKAGGKASS